ncbi:MAG: S8 family serine peptidase [Candidatus Eremiobacteraeota bacterium]|nr:S8 family serine peptidase [Candidatus Eremiobacteraeota bacterium]
MPVQHGFGGSAQFPIGIIVDGDANDSDLSQFYAAMRVNRTGNLIRLGSNNGTSPEGQQEAAVDVETVSALAPASTVYLYRIPSINGGDVVAGMNQVVTDNLVAVVSMSFGGCEKQPYPTYYEFASAEDSAAAQGSAQGITFVAASGDSGGPSNLSGCASVMAPAASSYVVAVGGTSPDAPNNNTSGGAPPDAYRSGYQYAWGQPTPTSADPPCSQNFCGSGGGASTHFQTSEQNNACGGSWRCVPDVSLAADFYHRAFGVYNGTSEPLAAGTSFATPIFSAIQAEIDQRQGTRKGNVVGRLYSIWDMYGYGAFAPGQPTVFQDITSGSNGYQASAGYDWASGIGSLDGWALSSVE